MAARPLRLSIFQKHARRVRQMHAMDRWIEQGKTDREAARRVHRGTRGDSAQTLITLYYRWIKSGRHDAVLRANYVCGSGLQWTAAQQQRLIEVMPAATSFAALHGLLFKGAKGAPGQTQFRRSFHAPEKQKLCKHFSEQRRALSTARRFAKWLRRPERSFAATGGPK